MRRIACWALLAAALGGACAGPRGAPLDPRAECQETGGVWLSDGTCFYAPR